MRIYVDNAASAATPPPSPALHSCILPSRPLCSRSGLAHRTCPRRGCPRPALAAAASRLPSGRGKERTRHPPIALRPAGKAARMFGAQRCTQPSLAVGVPWPRLVSLDMRSIAMEISSSLRALCKPTSIGWRANHSEPAQSGAHGWETPISPPGSCLLLTSGKGLAHRQLQRCPVSQSKSWAHGLHPDIPLHRVRTCRCWA